MKKILILMLMFWVTACSSPTPNFYQPVVIKDAEVISAQFKKTVLLNQILLPAEVSRPQITTLGKEDFEIKIDEFNRWGATPERLIQRVINQDLSLMLPNAVIENQTPLRKNYVYAVAVELQEMSGRLDDNAILKASYYIKNKQGKLVKSGKFEASTKIDGNYDEYVPAQSRLLGDLAYKIANDLAKLK